MAAIRDRSTISSRPNWSSIIGSNTAESHPVLATRVKRAHKLHGQKLIVADLRENEMARRADVFLHPKPGTDLDLALRRHALYFRQRPRQHRLS